jgi:prevent-host-death family protein
MTILKTLSATSAREKFFGLIDETAENHAPVLITTKRNNAVLIGEEDWNAIQETLHLLSVPGMRESITEGMNLSSDQMLSKEDFLEQLEQEV